MSAFAYKTLLGCLSGPLSAFESYRGLLLLSLAISYGYSSFVLGWRLQLLVTSQPAQIVVALLGLALFPTARARLSSNSNTPSGCDCSKANAAGQSSSSDDAAADSSAAAIAGSSTGSLLRTPSIRLARPPFAADLSCGASPSYSCSSTPSSSGSKTRRRRLPRVSIELTPLPRLSLEFQVKANSRRSSCSSRASFDDCTLYSPGSSSSGARWQPSMSRIRSGHDLQLLGAGEEAAARQQAAVWPAGMSLQDAPTAGEATESLGHGELRDGLQQVEQDVDETHLLQVGAMLGEASSRAALLAKEAGGPVGHPGSFYGSADSDAFLEPWELLVCESSSSVLYWAWRRPLRKGLYMYMTRSVFLGASPAELRAFMNDDAYRVVWDGSMNVLRQVTGPAAAGGAGSSNESLEAMAAAVAARMAGLSAPGSAAAAGSESCSGRSESCNGSSTLDRASSLLSPFEALASSSSSDASAADEAAVDEACSSSGGSRQAEVLLHESGIMQALVQFPKPMASRSYIYARRVWHRPSDGGCYCLSKACSYDAPPALPCRAVSVEDYVAGCVVRSPAVQLLPPGCAGPAAEVLMVYFEDSHVRPGLANLGIKKGLWPLLQKTDKALRVYQAGAAANMHLQSPQPPAAAAGTCRLQSSRSTPSPGLSRAASLQRGASLQAAAAAFESSSAAAAAESSSSSKSEIEAEVAQEASSCSSNCGKSVQSADPASCCSMPLAEVHTSAVNKSCKASSSSSSSSKGSGTWDWWHKLASTVGGAIKGSGQLLASASVMLWRSHTRLALMVPTLEWRLLHWLLQRLAAPGRLLLGAPPAAGAAGRGNARLSSHPIGDCLHPGLLRRLQQSSSGPPLLRVSSHPLRVEDLLSAAAEPEPPAAAGRSSGLSRRQPFAVRVEQQGAGSVSSSCCGSACGAASVCRLGGLEQQQQMCSSHEPLLGAEWPSVAEPHNLHSISCMHAHHVPCCCSQHAPRTSLAAAAGSEDALSGCGSSSMSAPASSCGCGRCFEAAAAAACLAASASCCSSRSSSSCCSAGGSMRVCGGGRRQRRVVVRLMQAAGVRLAHKLLSALEQAQPQPP